MPGLICSAQSCVYNNAMYCSRGDIQVGGENAKVCQDTCCESFQKRKCEQTLCSVGISSTHASIKCEAENCRYNENCACHADHVDIAGAAAGSCEETECVTFEDRCC